MSLSSVANDGFDLHCRVFFFKPDTVAREFLFQGVQVTLK